MKGENKIMTSLSRLPIELLCIATSFSQKREVENLKESSINIKRKINDYDNTYREHLSNRNIDQATLKNVINRSTKAQLADMINKVFNLPKMTDKQIVRFVATIVTIAEIDEGRTALMKNRDVITPLTTFAKKYNTPLVREWVAAAFANIARNTRESEAGVGVRALIEKGAIETLNFLASQARTERERINIACAIGNIARNGINGYKGNITGIVSEGIADLIKKDIIGYLTTFFEEGKSESGRIQIIKAIEQIIVSITTIIRNLNQDVVTENNIVMNLINLAISSKTKTERGYTTQALELITSIEVGSIIFIGNNGVINLKALAQESSTPLERTNIAKVIRWLSKFDNERMRATDYDELVKILIQFLTSNNASEDELTAILNAIKVISEKKKGKKALITNNGFEILKNVKDELTAILNAIKVISEKKKGKKALITNNGFEILKNVKGCITHRLTIIEQVLENLKEKKMICCTVS